MIKNQYMQFCIVPLSLPDLTVVKSILFVEISSLIFYMGNKNFNNSIIIKTINLCGSTI